ncbi:hypothetical protein BDF20DRAFT_941300 [Mycotypha africana]|uniref:uncharacterized protein n=1 Tax=Mycotypha africana TaxID=64632 RepID=UPI0023004A75|nr:uncharacterized protein BDF20DRAFT_941300 [Mycotypha africana]KAI8977082.1 hypothetical protein BDF20DRAFT_941300 [Mycotypha africana]
MDFSKNCASIDEAGFTLHTRRNQDPSLKGTPAKSTVPTGKCVTFTILGAISQACIINVGVKTPEPASSKKRRARKAFRKKLSLFCLFLFIHLHIFEAMSSRLIVCDVCKTTFSELSKLGLHNYRSHSTEVNVLVQTRCASETEQ